jgi:hypothetical protein
MEDLLLEGVVLLLCASVLAACLYPLGKYFYRWYHHVLLTYEIGLHKKKQEWWMARKRRISLHTYRATETIYQTTIYLDPDKDSLLGRPCTHAAVDVVLHGQRALVHDEIHLRNSCVPDDVTMCLGDSFSCACCAYCRGCLYTRACFLAPYYYCPRCLRERIVALFCGRRLLLLRHSDLRVEDLRLIIVKFICCLCFDYEQILGEKRILRKRSGGSYTFPDTETLLALKAELSACFQLGFIYPEGKLKAGD